MCHRTCEQRGYLLLLENPPWSSESACLHNSQGTTSDMQVYVAKAVSVNHGLSHSRACHIVGAHEG